MIDFVCVRVSVCVCGMWEYELLIEFLFFKLKYGFITIIIQFFSYYMGYARYADENLRLEMSLKTTGNVRSVN